VTSFILNAVLSIFCYCKCFVAIIVLDHAQNYLKVKVKVQMYLIRLKIVWSHCVWIWIKYVMV